MTEADYYEIVEKILGLRPTRFKETFLDSNNEPYSVPLAKDQTPAERVATIRRLKRLLGIEVREEGN